MAGGLFAPDTALVPLVNQLRDQAPLTIFTQDWYSPDHKSFASQHPGAQPFHTVRMSCGEQVLWPDHGDRHGPPPGGCGGDHRRPHHIARYRTAVVGEQPLDVEVVPR